MADPTSVTQYQYGFAPELKPYAESLLGQAQAYTDVGQNPYQSYTGQRVAQSSPLQQQSYDYASQMRSAPQLQDATALAGQAGLGGLNAQYTFQPSNFTAQNAQEMMNPFLDTMNAATRRNAAISQQGQQAQAANAGAFGGGRDAIMRNQGNAELQRNLAQNQYNAFNQAQQQYNTQYGQNAAQQQFGAGLGMQGLGIANQAAQNLGALGQTQYGQNMGITGLQNQFGLQQQQQAQNLLNTQYEDFTNAQNYPYKQMGFMSDILRGTPVSQTGASMYQAPPTTIQNLTSLGLGAAGISSLMKADGGTVRSYANGGAIAFDGGGSTNQLGTMVQSDLESAYQQAVNTNNIPKIKAYKSELEYRDRVKNYRPYAYGGSVMSPEFKQYAVGHIDPRQLPMAQRNAQARGDLETNQFAMQEMADDAALRRGIAPALPPGTDVVRAAGGGILAFAEPTEENNYSLTNSGGGGGYNLDAKNPFVKMMMENAQNIRDAEYKGVTPEEYNKAIETRHALLSRLFGTNEAATTQTARLKEDDEARAGALDQNKGMALLEAASAVLQPGGTMRGLGAAGAAFGRSYGQALQLDKAEKRAINRQQFDLADSLRKEKMGILNDSIKAADQLSPAKREEYKSQLEKFKALANIGSAGARAMGKAGGAGGDKTKLNEMLAKAEIAHETNPTDASLKTVTALRRAVDRTKTTDVGPGKQEAAANTLTGSQNRKLSDHMANFVNSTAYKKAKRTSEAEADALYDAEQTRKQTELMQGIKTGGGSGTTLKFDASGKQLN